MVNEKERSRIIEYTVENLKDSSIFDEVEVGQDISRNYIDDRQNKRDIFAQRYDGEEFVIMANADPYPSKKLLEEKIDNLSSNGVYLLPILYENNTDNGKKVFHKPARNHYGASIEHYKPEFLDRIINTNLTERTLMEYADDNLVYFDYDNDELLLVSYNSDYDVVGRYYDNPDVPYDEDRLKKARVKENERRIEKFAPGRYPDKDKMLLSLPVDLTDIWNGVRNCKIQIERDKFDLAQKTYDRIKNKIENDKYPDRLFREELDSIEYSLENNIGFGQLKLF